MYSTKEAANSLQLSQDHVRLLAKNGLIKVRKIGRD
jgi:excisionase family DNA binding protein